MKHVVLIDRPNLYQQLGPSRGSLSYPCLMSWLRTDEALEEVPCLVTGVTFDADDRPNRSYLGGFGIRVIEVNSPESIVNAMMLQLEIGLTRGDISAVTIVTGGPTDLTEQLDSFGPELATLVLGVTEAFVDARPRPGMYHFLDIRQLPSVISVPKPGSRRLSRRAKREASSLPLGLTA